MDANDIKLQALLNAPNRYIIPVFQRYYSWKEDNWVTLWEDIQELREPENLTRTHFFGSLVFFPLKPSVSGPQGFQVIDGQQRLMTFSLLFCALRYVAHQHGLKELEAEIHERFLVHRFRKGPQHFRVYPRQRDRDQYIKAVTTPTLEIEGRMGDALRFLVKEVEEIAETDAEANLHMLFDLLQTRLDFVYIALDGENPYQIFKSLNSTGVDLSEADLIRNFVFMHMDLSKQDEFDDECWRPLESHFEDEDGALKADSISRFFRFFLMQNGEYVPKAGTFEAFENRYLETGFDPTDLAQELKRNAELYDIIRGVQPHTSKRVTASLAKLRQLESSTTYPLLLNLMHREQIGTVSAKELSQAIEQIAGFILRRYACSESSRAYGRWFVRACARLTDKALHNLSVFLKERGFPTDARFKSAFSRFPWYERGYAWPVLEALERSYKHKEPADLSSATIEHIMPRTLTDAWRAHLGPEAERVYEEWLHTIGNLTLSAYNIELRNHLFTDKRQEYEKSNITLNRRLAEFSQWTELEVRKRGEQLAEIAARIWMGPDA